MSEFKLDRVLIQKAAAFGIRFSWEGQHTVRMDNLENVSFDNVHHFKVLDEDKEHFQMFLKMFLETYRPVTDLCFIFYIRKTVNVGDFVRVGNDTYLLIDEQTVVRANTNNIPLSANQKLFAMNEEELLTQITPAFV